jgi:hypothetical protein
MSNYKYKLKTKKTILKPKLKNNKIKYTYKKTHKEKIVSFKSRRICPILSKEHLSIFYIYIGIINTLISGNTKYDNTKYNVNYNHLYFGKNKQYNKMFNNKNLNNHFLEIRLFNNLVVFISRILFKIPFKISKYTK